VAKPSEKDLEYVKRAEAMHWSDLAAFWEAIKAENTPDWEGGKALEHIVVRAFQLGGSSVEYPYDVPPASKPIEQIDGLVHVPRGPSRGAAARPLGRQPTGRRGAGPAPPDAD
jgi:hypothetical protein